MKKYIAIIIFMVGILSLRAQDLTISYQLVDNTNGTETVEVYMTNNTGFPMQIGAVNLSVMFQHQCAGIIGHWSRFEQTWGQAVEGVYTFSLNRNYEGIAFDQRWQYGNTTSNVNAPESVDLPADPNTQTLMMTLDIQKSCDLNLYLENLSENRANEIVDILGNPISYEIQQIETKESGIKLISFEAFQTGESAVQLEWITSEEAGSVVFVVEKSLDGIVFEAVGTVDAAGESSELKAYELKDKRVKSPVNYFRLKMVDIEGNFTYSEIRQVNMVGDFEYFISLYPNPASVQLTLSSSNNIDKSYEMIVTDLSGKIVAKRAQLILGQRTAELSVEGLSTGTYIVELIDTESGKTFSRRFVKF